MNLYYDSRTLPMLSNIKLPKANKKLERVPKKHLLSNINFVKLTKTIKCKKTKHRKALLRMVLYLDMSCVSNDTRISKRKTKLLCCSAILSFFSNTYHLLSSI